MEKTENRVQFDVKKQMCLTPADDYTEMQFKALKVINKFRMIGFSTWGSFYAEVCKEHPEMEVYINFRRLQAFWHLRNFDAEMIEKLEVLADNLKEEA